MALSRSREGARPAFPAALALAGVAGLLILWELSTRAGLMSSLLAPPPSAVLPALARELESGIWFEVVLDSLSHYAIGVALGSFLGVCAGLAVALFPRFDALQAGVARILRPIPPLAWIPFAIIWFGISETAAAFIIAIGVFWLNYFATSAAVRVVDPDYLELARAFGHGGFRARLTKVVLPAASPGIMGGLRAGLGQGWMTVVAAELFGIPGIGQRMMEASGLLATDVVLLYMLTIALLYAISDAAFQFVSRRALSWLP